MIAIRSFPQDNIIVARATALQAQITRKARNQGHDSPDDFFSEMCLELLKKARQENPEEITDAYLWRLVDWRLCDWHRSRKRRPPAVLLDQSANTCLEVHSQHVDSVDDKMYVEHMLSQLPAKDRDIIERKFFRNQDLAEIAQDLGLTPDGVRSRAHRAMAALKRRWQT